MAMNFGQEMLKTTEVRLRQSDSNAKQNLIALKKKTFQTNGAEAF